MSTRTITSPGVQITEIDQSQIARNSAGTNVFMTGFASQGPTDEVVYIGSVSEFESTFGTPTNEAERYLYHSARQVLVQSPANLKVTRMAYGSGSGIGFGNSYSALVFPVKGYIQSVANQLSSNVINFTNDSWGGRNGSTPELALNAFTLDSIVYGTSAYHYQTFFTDTTGNYRLSITGATSAYTLTINNSAVLSTYINNLPSNYKDANYYEIQPPQSVLLTESEYQDVISNNISWDASYSEQDINSSSKLGHSGIIVLNPTKVAVDNIHQGYYIGFADNRDNNPGSDFKSVTGVKAVDQVYNNQYQTFTNIPTNRLNFALSGSHLNVSNSISRTMEQYPTGYDFSSSTYNDCLTLMTFKLRTSIYAQDTVTLDYRVQEGYTGSLYNNKTQNNPNGGAPVTFALEKVAAQNSRSSDMKVIVNPIISSTGDWISSDGKTPKKSVRVSDAARNIYSLGVYVSQTDTTSCDIGNVPLKLQRILNRLDDMDEEIDLIPEAGLGTIWAGAAAKKASVSPGNTSDGGYFFDEKYPISSALMAELKNQTGGNESILKQNYDSIVQQFYTFAEKTRMDHMFIPDPLRYIFVNGPDFKTTKISTYNFSLDIYWPLKNLFGDISSSYGATYGNWIKFNDVYSNQMVWLPNSGYVAADIAFSSAVNFPWSAPAGFNRGVLTNIVDIAINPTQKQRDLLYRININPIAYFPGEGYVIYGQKTLMNKPSAFDRINVRRLFLTLEKVTKNLLKYYVFEPNTFATRSRLINALSPTFNQAKANDGLYDYRIICDERNNTPDVIDNNELKISIYIQAVRTAEYILADFVGTRTGINFNELTS